MEDDIPVDDAIIQYIIKNQNLQSAKLSKKGSSIVIKPLREAQRNNRDDNSSNDSDPSFMSDSQPNRYANINIADAIENLIDNEATTNPDVVQGLELKGFNPNDEEFYFCIEMPSYIGNSMITAIRVCLYDVSQDTTINLEIKENEFKIRDLKENTMYHITVELENNAGYKSVNNPIFKIITHRFSSHKKHFNIISDNSNGELPDQGAYELEKLSYLVSKIKFSNNVPLRMIDLSVGGNALCLLDTGGILHWGNIISNRDQTINHLPIQDISQVQEYIERVHIPLTGCLIRDISCGKNFCLALSCTGQIYSWGYNTYGQLGCGDYLHRPNANRVISKQFFTKIQAGYQNCYAEDDKNNKYAWGKNISLRYVVSSQQNIPVPFCDNHQNSPRKLDFYSTTNIQRVEIGNSLYGFLCSDKRLYTMGKNTYGQLGFDTPNGLELPICDQPHKLDIPRQVIDFSVGKYHILYMDDLNDIYGFGRNKEHQIKKTDVPYYRAPVCAKKGSQDVKKIIAFNNTSVIKYQNGSFWYLSENHKVDYLHGDIIHKNYKDNMISEN